MDKSETETAASARCCAGMAFDWLSHSTVVFGGTTATTRFGETWVWQNGSWSKLSPPKFSISKTGASIVYDGSTGTIVLFGGFDQSGTSLNDTLTWDGTTWTEQFPSVSPSGRRFDTQGIAYDAATQLVVLFGGVTSSTRFLGDTWTCNGKMKTWTQQFPAASPTPRRAMLAYDRARRNVVPFCGDIQVSEFGDTWTGDGVTWSQQQPHNAPPPRGQVPWLSMRHLAS